jgi:hypothetical protein
VSRLLPLLFAFLGLLIVAIARQQAGRPRSERTYRPRAGRWDGLGRGGASRRAAEDVASEVHWVTPRADLAGVRDAYSSATLDPEQPLSRCGGCQAFYQQSSLEALRAQNLGRCALCGSADLRSVRVL